MLCGALLAGLVATAWLIFKDGEIGAPFDSERLLRLSGLWLTMSTGALLLAIPIDALARWTSPAGPGRAAAAWALVGFIGGWAGASGGALGLAAIAIAIEVFALPGGLIGLIVWFIERPVPQARSSSSDR